MPKKREIKKPAKGKKLTKQGVERPKKPEATVKVLLPVPIPGRGVYDPPSEYELSYEDAILCVEIERLAAKGYTNDQIIDQLPISRDTFYKRIKNEPYFSYCLLKHRGVAVLEVESALKKAAMGFEYLEQHCSANGKVVTLMKAKTPDTGAIKFFLTNRDPKNWKNKVEATHEAGESMGGMVFAIKRRED